MDSFLLYLQINFPLVIQYKYLLLFLGALIEGMNFIILGGFLVSVGAVSFFPTFLLCVLGEALNGYAWYYVGYFAGSKPLDKWGRSKPRSRMIIEKVQGYFERYSGRAIVFTKLTWSLTIATLVMAGSLKYNLKKFFYYNLLGSAGWVALTFFTGLFFGQSYKFFLVYLKNVTYFLVFLGGAVALIYVLKWLFMTAFIKSLIAAENIREIGDKIRGKIDRFLSDRE